MKTPSNGLVVVVVGAGVVLVLIAAAGVLYGLDQFHKRRKEQKDNKENLEALQGQVQDLKNTTDGVITRQSLLIKRLVSDRDIHPRLDVCRMQEA